MAIKLKQFRVNAGLTQTKLAKAVGVSQPNYQRWEAGSTQIPDDKLKKLAKVLKTSVEALLGRHAPIEAVLYNKSVGEELNYYGEVAVHFVGGGRPILLSISDSAYQRLYRDLQEALEFLTVESLANQTVIIRTKAIADLYFSSEAYDTYGPEHGDYEDHIELQMPDPRDWEIVEALSFDDPDFVDFAAEDVKRVSERIMITDDQYDQLVKEGLIRPEERKAAKERDQKETNKIFDLAVQLKYQFSNGIVRTVNDYETKDLFEAFHLLVDYGEDIGSDLIRMPIAGWHRTAFINKDALDYVMMPTHRFNQGRLEVDAEELEELE